MIFAEKKINVAVCGIGHWGRNYVRLFNEIQKSSVTWCCDLKENNLIFVREQYPHIPVTRAMEDILKDTKTQAVVVATSAAGHYSLVKQCLESGKDVLVEKPLALKLDEAEKLVEMAEHLGRILMVGHTFLYNPAVRKVKELIDAGEIGKIYYLKAVRSHLGLIREDVNVAWDLATHDVSIFNYLLDAEPVDVKAFGIRFLSADRDDAAFIVLQYKKELLGHIHVSWADSDKQRTVEVVGSKGRILFDDLNTLEPVRLFQRGISLDHDVSNFGEYKYLLRDGDIISPNIKMQEPLRIQAEHFLECIAQRTKPLTDGENGLRVVRALCKVDRSLDETRAQRLAP